MGSKLHVAFVALVDTNTLFATGGAEVFTITAAPVVDNEFVEVEFPVNGPLKPAALTVPEIPTPPITINAPVVVLVLAVPATPIISVGLGVTAFIPKNSLLPGVG